MTLFKYNNILINNSHIISNSIVQVQVFSYNSIDSFYIKTSQKLKAIQQLGYDPSKKIISNAQSYFSTLYNRQEITLRDKNTTNRKFVHVWQAHGVPKLYKNYDHLPSSRPVIDITNTVHYGIAKHLPNLLYPLIEKEFTVNDLFETGNKFKAISSELFVEDYRFITFNAKLLFNNVPLNRIIEKILKRINEDKVIHTTLLRKQRM